MPHDNLTTTHQDASEILTIPRARNGGWLVAYRFNEILRSFGQNVPVQFGDRPPRSLKDICFDLTNQDDCTRLLAKITTHPNYDNEGHLVDFTLPIFVRLPKPDFGSSSDADEFNKNTRFVYAQATDKKGYTRDIRPVWSESTRSVNKLGADKLHVAAVYGFQIVPAQVGASYDFSLLFKAPGSAALMSIDPHKLGSATSYNPSLS